MEDVMDFDEIIGSRPNDVMDYVMNHYKDGSELSYMGKDDCMFHYQDKTVHIITKDVDIPFVLVVPDNCEGKQLLSMTTNNLESTDSGDILRSGLSAASQFSTSIQDGGPIIVPILPSNGNSGSDGIPYWQQLAPECFDKQYKFWNSDKQFDECLFDSIDKAKDILHNDYDMECDDRLFIHGYSSSGAFAQRFCTLHPEAVRYANIGGASCTMTVMDDTISYPAGTGNLPNGRTFDKDSYKQIQFDSYIGQYEYDMPAFDDWRLREDGSPSAMHDGYDSFDRTCPREIANACKAKYGIDPHDRIFNILVNLDNNNIKVNHMVIPGVTHNQHDRDYMNSVVEQLAPLSPKERMEALAPYNLTRRQVHDLKCVYRTPAKAISDDGLIYDIVNTSYQNALQDMRTEDKSYGRSLASEVALGQEVMFRETMDGPEAP